jgi:4-hydroxy-tetrahydrodipicolinate synthase
MQGDTAKQLRGLWVPLLTPFRDDLTVDYDRLGPFCRERLDDGCHGLALMGTTSETPSLSVAERMKIHEVALAAGVSPLQITCGTGACALPDAVELTRHAVQTGCLATMLLPPWYFKDVGDDGCFRCIAAVIERVADPRLRVVLYNIPSLSGVTFTPAVVRRLVDAFGEVIVGVKDSSGDPMSTLRFTKALRDLAVLPGTEGYLVAALRSGAAGCVTATANVRARPIRELLDDPTAADARERQSEIGGFRAELERELDIIVACKRMLAARTGHAAWALVRPPL